jgi:hypothetical protein
MKNLRFVTECSLLRADGLVITLKIEKSFYDLSVLIVVRLDLFFENSKCLKNYPLSIFEFM